MANIASVAGSSPAGSAASLQSPSPGISLDMPPGPRQSSVPSPTALLLDTTTSMGVVGGVFYGLIHVVPGFLVWLVTFTTITVPTVLFSLASTSLTVTLNATTLVFLILAFVSTVSWVVRYRYLTMYARLPPEPQRSENQIDLFPELPEGDSKRGLSNYLDEFLSAIKVFGYLERPVFHELTRTMQTKKLIAGETLMLEEEQGFCLVVDGSVQIFVKSKRNDGSPSPPHANGDGGEDDRDSRWGNQGYQLLTEVKNGAPMSSLFSILSLFTEDVKLRHDEHDEVGSRPPSRPSRSMHVPGTVTPLSSTMDGIQVDVSGSPRIPNARMRTTSTVNNLEGDGVLPRVPHMDLDHDNGEHQHYQTQEQQDHKQPGSAKHARRRRNESFHPDVVARATVDTTIAIIPATAFRRLTRTYPKASAHIVQVILSRLQRVTLTTGHAYLGLTSEVLRIEKLINRFTNYDLPDPLRGAALERLKEKFAKERERTTQEERTKGIALHKPRPQRSTRRDSGLGKHIAVQSMAARGRTGSGTGNMSENISFASPSADRSSVNAGDLLSLSQRNRSARHSSMSFSQPFHTALQEARGVVDQGSYSQSNARSGIASQVQDTADEDNFFRDSIVDCMLKAIGLTNEKNAIPGGSESVAQSPRLVSYDSRRHKAVFNNAFGFMDPLDMSADNDSESVLSIPASSTSVLGGTSIEDELSKDVEIVFFPQGSVLVEQGENNPGLYYVIDGFLDVSVPADDPKGLTPDGSAASPGAGDLFSVGPKGEPISSHGFGSLGPFGSKPTSEKGAKTSQPRQSLYLTKPGGLAGYLGTISSRRSFVDVTAKTDVYVGFLPRASIERIVEKYPIVLLTMAKRLTSLIPKLILHIDFALEWVQIDAGQTVYRQGQESDAIYIVLNGRLRALQQGTDSKVKVMGEYGQGDSVGELEVLTESKRPATLHAIRDTELAKLPKTLFNSLALENPEITIKISKIIATRMRDLMEDQSLEQKRDKLARAGTSSSSNINMRTVAVLPVTSGVPVVEFGGRLMQALTQIGHTNGVVSLNHAAILSHLGRHAFSRMGKLKLSQHLADLEEKYGLVLYVADTNVNSPWTQTCINQADCILLVALAEGSPNIGEYERLLITTKTTARKELVLLHSERYCPPGLTRRWLRNRMWINGSHHHIQMAFRNPIEPVHPQTRRFGNALKQRVQVIQAEIQKYTSRRVQHTPLYSADSPFKSDFHRLARRLTGKSVGLVLGGGGARGIAHIGIIRALEESGIPIDIVGGTSIGAFVGALYAWDGDVVPMYGRAKKFAGRMGSMWRFALDLTYPTASYTTGHEFNRGIYKTFGNAQIEDFWLEFYCNTTNISKSRPEIHTSGYVWRFVRASMSLAGLVPPMCDEGNMLLDGGYLDNLTVAHMKSLGADIIFAVDVGAVDDQSPQAFGDSLSGFWAVINRWNPFSNVPNAPTLSEIQGKLAYVSSIDTLEKAKSLPGCRYMRPPVVDYATLEFGKFEEIYLLGHKYGKEFIKSLREKGLLGIGEIEGEERKNMRRTMAPRRASI